MTVLVLLCSGYLGMVCAQTKEELVSKKGKTQEEIEYTSRLLEETRKKKQTSLNSVRILNRRIQLRNQLLQSINQEILLFNKEIESKTRMIEDMETDLDLIKRQYEMLVQFAYWNKNKYDRLMFVMSAENFNMAYKRMKYIQQYSSQRKEQARMIQSIQEELKSEISELEKAIVQKEELARQKEGENRNLEIVLIGASN